MFSTFSTALSALRAHSTALDVVGNNLANLNTTGFKNSSIVFRDLMSQSLGSDTQVGEGVDRPTTERQFLQGAVQSSGGLMDAAIQGDGFFVLRDARGNTLFSRAGNFHLDSAGRLVAVNGARVQGWMGTATTGAVSDIVVALGAAGPPKPSQTFSIDMNLDARAAAAATQAAPYSFTTSLQVFDSLGAPHSLAITMTTNGAGGGSGTTWTASAALDGGAPITLTDPTLSFDNNGQLVPKTPAQAGPPPVPAVYPTITIPAQTLGGGATLGPLTWQTANASNMPRLTQFAATSAASSSSQDGSGSSEMVRVSISDGGAIVAHYSNGQDSLVGQLALAAIRNPDTMLAVGDNALQATSQTSAPTIGLPDSGGRGKIIGAALESSTVDIAAEFTNLITYQRGYQANSRVITTSDELSQETINLKR